MVNTKEIREELENMQIGEVRKQASAVYGIKALPQHTKAEIIEMIVAEASRTNVELSNGALKPGYARIRLHQTDGRSDADVLWHVNGQNFFVPMNKEVDVPIKLYEAMRTSQEDTYVQEKNGRTGDLESQNEVKGTRRDSYPFSLLGIVPGPDPRPTPWEISRDRMLKDYYAFRDSEGFWPSKERLHEWKVKRSNSSN